jgi:catechol 2,3-dioxygenase-like lactoylglutathione lyase family enzyme
MDRINHVKIVTPDPEAVDRFLREVLDIPEGWVLGERPTTSRSADGGELSMAQIEEFRGISEFRGFIAGSTASRQFQILQGSKAHIWAVAIGTRHLERAHERCRQQGISCTDPAVTGWGDGAIRFFFAEVGGILFEVMRAEEAEEPG